MAAEALSPSGNEPTLSPGKSGEGNAGGRPKAPEVDDSWTSQATHRSKIGLWAKQKRIKGGQRRGREGRRKKGRARGFPSSPEAVEALPLRVA